MATYSSIKGAAVQTLASNSDNQGQIWYDTASNPFKLQKYNAASWASGGSRSNYTFRGAGFGTTTDAVSSGGTQTPPPTAGPINTVTEVYNGTSWTSGTAAPLNLGYVTAGGTSSAGIVNTGESPPGSGTTTIEYASGTWTSGGTQTYASQNAIGAGLQDDYIQTGGVFQPSYSPMNDAQKYDGTSWTSITVYPVSNAKGGAAGTSALAFFYGGDNPSSQTLCNDWSGSAWTSAPAIPTASNAMAQNNGGPVTAALNACAGTSTTCLLYNGTSWSTDAAASNASPDGLSGAGTGTLATAGLLKWGSPGSNSLLVEEYSGAGVTSATITTS